MSAQILKALGLGPVNSGTYLGNGEWSKTSDAGLLQSINPSTNEVIAEVHASSASDYETIIARAQAAFASWRTVPAPRRGEAVRLCGDCPVQKTRLILLTPIADAMERVGDLQTLAVIGTADAYFDTLMTDHDKRPNVTWRVLEGLNHALETEDDWRASLDALREVTAACDAFLQETGK